MNFGRVVGIDRAAGEGCWVVGFRMQVRDLFSLGWLGGRAGCAGWSFGWVGGGWVLSVGKLGAGQQSYYLEAVARGVEDYYGGRGEAAGRWVGAGAETFGAGGCR